MKINGHAAEYWGSDTLKDVPKAVWATVAWHLANVMSGSADSEGAAEEAFLAELLALAEAGIIPAQQAKSSAASIRAALRRARGEG